MADEKLRRFAFVIMPFADTYTPVYNEFVVPAVEACGLKCIRADKETQGHIHSQMLQRIYESATVIADITGLNANVFYELGVAHSCGCKTIVICNQDSLDKVPFDIAPYRVFAYKYPDPGNPDNLKETVQELSMEIREVISDQSLGIPNPVQDYLVSQSPIWSSNSLFINKLDALHEDQLLRTATSELVYYGITANSFSDLLTGILESRQETDKLEVHLCLLDPEAYDCWDFLYRMFAGGSVDADTLTQNREEDILTQRRVIRRLKSLESRIEGFSLNIHYFSSLPVFWAYLVDNERLVVGHLAMQRLSSRNLPVNILVRSDRTTQNLFSYYFSVIESAMNKKGD